MQNHIIIANHKERGRTEHNIRLAKLFNCEIVADGFTDHHELLVAIAELAAGPVLYLSPIPVVVMREEIKFKGAYILDSKAFDCLKPRVDA